MAGGDSTRWYITADGDHPVTPIPTPALVVLVGASGSGKTTWARAHFASSELVSSDSLRAIVGTGEGDLDASVDAFAILDAIVAARTRRGLTTVIDTLGLDPARRQAAVRLGHDAGLPVVAVRFETEARLCRERNRTRIDQCRRMHWRANYSGRRRQTWLPTGSTLS